MTANLANDLSTKIDNNIMKYMPNVYKDFDIIKKFNRRADSWMRDKQYEIENAISTLEQFKEQQLEFKVNTMKAEVDFFTKVFTPEKLESFDKIARAIENVETTLIIQDTKIMNCAKLEQIDEFYQMVEKTYATKHKLENLEDKIIDFVGREEFSKL